MKWTKLGRIFDPTILEEKKLTCALMPIVEILDEKNDIVRVYFSPRDEQSRSQLYFFDININNPSYILNISESALFTHGKLGTFDDCGVTPGSFSEVNGTTAFFYTGWSLTKTVPMNNSIGIALLNKESGKFERIGHGPIMTRTLHEPFSCASPFVLKENGKYRMWYASMDDWKELNGEPLHYYNVKYAESVDGLNWSREAKVSINYERENEYAFGRPFILKENGLYKMWYAFRGDRYEIGYAESSDGYTWTRKDELAGIDISAEGWDSEMIEYPFIFDYKSKRYMFYNGNGYGRTGIGLAVLTEN